ncbi:probable flavin-containing monoamine oxidase A [Anabrus simplex]|uniref:probable flavin-containing monoamine oxidase A n=1 Tax=Anabrus simplex TaxID=316456 RepID=UPI0035A310F0
MFYRGLTSISSNDMSFFKSDSVTSYYETDVIVVGAGLSGLTAAYRISKRDSSLRVIVLEAKERIGGRILTVSAKTAKNPENIDLGGQWINSEQNYILNLLDELRLKTYRNPHNVSEGYKVGQAGAPVWQKFQSFPIFGPWYCQYELYQFILQVEKLVKKTTLFDPMGCSFADEFDSMTMETFLCQNLRTLAARDIMRTLIRVMFGTEPREMSALFFLAYSNGTNGFLNQFDTSTSGARELRIKGGAQQVCEMLMKKISKEFVFLGDPVEKVSQLDERIFVTVLSKKYYRCEYLIMAIPPNELNRVTFIPPLPLQKRRLLQRFPVGHLTKFVLTYAKPFWRRNGYTGDILTYGGAAKEPGCDTGPLSITYDATTEHGHPAIIGYIAAKTGMQWGEKSVGTRKRGILESLCQVWGTDALKPLDYVEKNWSEEEYVGGCPIHVAPPGAMPLLHHLRTPFLRIHWAGTETATHWCGYMNGAVQAGHRAAVEVLYELRPQSLTATDLEEIGTTRVQPTPMTHSVPLMYRWQLWAPVSAITFGAISYVFYKRYIAT